MVIGTGDIAKAIIDRPGFVFLASGASNRHGEPTFADLRRETDLILTHNKNHVVYFSTLSIYYSCSNYTTYKLEIEGRIKQICENYTIIRIGNITWGDNPNTLLNYLKAHPEAERRDEWRYLIDKDELNHWLGLIPLYGKHEMNIPGKRINVKDL